MTTRTDATRTAAATAARRRKDEERWAVRLRSRGWICVRPEEADSVSEAMAAFNEEALAGTDDHREDQSWSGAPGECGVQCICGFSVDGFASIANARTELLHHIRECS